mgnify:CR=1 FL=1
MPKSNDNVDSKPMLSLNINEGDGDMAKCTVDFDKEDPRMPQIFEIAYATMHQTVMTLIMESGASPEEALQGLLGMMKASINKALGGGDDECGCDHGCDCSH